MLKKFFRKNLEKLSNSQKVARITFTTREGFTINAACTVEKKEANLIEIQPIQGRLDVDEINHDKPCTLSHSDGTAERIMVNSFLKNGNILGSLVTANTSERKRTKYKKSVDIYVSSYLPESPDTIIDKPSIRNVNLSGEGMTLRLAKEMPPETIMGFQIRLPGQIGGEFKCEGKVLRTLHEDNRYLTTIRFTKISKTAQEDILEFISTTVHEHAQSQRDII